MFFRDPILILILPALVLAIYAQSRVRSAFRTYGQISTASRLTGAQAATQLLQTAGAGEVQVEKTPGDLTDYYDPRKKVLRLSQGIHDSSSIAALGIAAHKTGHAIQHHINYQPMALRALIYPAASLGSTLAFPLFFAGFTFSRGGANFLMDIGILLFTGAVAVSVALLPVEFNASKRALVLLEERRDLTPDELAGARKVLSAAALAGIAATAKAAVRLPRMLLLRSSRD